MAAELDCELTRLRVDREMRDAVAEAARRKGITESAWRKITYAEALTIQLGPGWRSNKQRGE